MGGRTVVSDNEDDFVHVKEEHPWPSRRGRDDMDDRDDDDEEEDEEEGHDEYEKDAFIVDDADEEEEEEEEQRESDDERRKKKKRKKRESEEFMLDENDYMLLQDNNIHGIQRPRHGTRFKRFKKAGRESEMNDRSGFSGDDGSGKKRTAEERVHSSLFGDHQGVSFEEDIVEEDQQTEDDEVGADDEG